MKTLILILSFSLSTVSINAQNYSGKKAAIDKILENTDAFSEAYMNADYEALANSYSEDAKILPPGTDIISGREDIKKRWILPEGVKILLHKVSPQEIKVLEKYAYDMGYYEGKTKRKNGEVVVWKGKYLIVWKKERNDWKIYMDAWNGID